MIRGIVRKVQYRLRYRLYRAVSRFRAAPRPKESRLYQGYIDEITPQHVAGWVRDRLDAGQKLAVEAATMQDGQEIRFDSVVADQPSPGLAAGEPDNALHGFRIVFPAPLTEAQFHALTVRVAGTRFTLPPAPHIHLPAGPAFEEFREDGFDYGVDEISKFYNTLRVFGWFTHPADTLKSVRIVDDSILASVSEVGLRHDGVVAICGPDRGFSVQVIRNTEPLSDTAELEFTSNSGWTGRANLKRLCRAKMEPRFQKTSRLLHDFLAQLDKPGIRILDVGGRSRSGLDRSGMFKHAECVVLDILPGENVDIVGDAHAMGKLLPAGSFDAILSVSVFEHILMPWAVAVQMNQVLKPGGLVLIFTHQTVGMHDLPWDFWRFSDTAWDALFNEKTGFEIVDRALSFEQHIVSFIWSEETANEERACGFRGSAVVARKTGPSEMSWDITPSDIVKTMYPV
jgi:hypothetical protein